MRKTLGVKVATSDQIQELSQKIEAANQAVRHNEVLFQAVQKSLDVFMSRLSMVLGVIIFVAGLIATVNGVLQSSRIDSQIEDARAQIRDVLSQSKPQIIQEVSMKGDTDRDDTLFADTSISYDDSTALVTYGLDISIYIKVKFEGRGVNYVNGFYVKYNKELINKIYPEGTNIFPERFINGSIFSFPPVKVVPGYFYNLAFGLTTRDISCVKMENLQQEFERLEDIGSLEVTPIFDLKPENDATAKFKVYVRKGNKVWTCKDLFEAHLPVR